MPDLESFEAEVKAKIKQLASSKDAAVRRQAAEWLGEAGDPTAITSLASAYKSDKDVRVREAARYSLGMFRKLEQALEDDNDAAMQTLEDIALKGKIGQRLRFPTRSLVKVEFGLLLSAILVALLAFVLPPMLRGGSGSGTQQTVTQPTTAPDSNTPTDKDRPTLVADLTSALALLSANATKLQGQYQGVLGGGALNCSETFDSLTPVQLSSNNTRDFPDLATAAQDINNAQQSLGEAKAAYDRVCEQEQDVPASDFGAPMASVVAVLQGIPAIQQTLSGIIPAEATPTPEAALVPEVQPTTVDTTALRNHISSLEVIIDNMSAVRGPYTLLNQFWTEAGTTGTEGCGQLINTTDIPADYTVPPEDAQTYAGLSLAADLVNTGLRLLRQEWESFAASCGRNTTGPDSVAGLQLTQSVKTAFDNASIQLDALKAGL